MATTNDPLLRETRAKHLEWCKQRALQYCERGDIQQAVASMGSDMGKHPETDGHPAIALMVQMLMSGLFSTPADCAKFIKGFN